MVVLSNYLKPFTRKEIEWFKQKYGDDSFITLTKLYNKQYEAKLKDFCFDIELRPCYPEKPFAVIIWLTIARYEVFTAFPFLHESEVCVFCCESAIQQTQLYYDIYFKLENRREY